MQNPFIWLDKARMKNITPRDYRFLICLFSLILLSAELVQAQELPTQTIRGIIVDADSEEPIIAANVVLVNTSPPIGTSCDLDGSFRLDNVPVGRYTLAVSCLGYEDAFANELLVAAGKEVVLNIKLKESVLTLKEVAVTGSD